MSRHEVMGLLYQYLVVTLINVLYHSSPFYAPYMDKYTEDDRYHTIRYGVPHHRILDRFKLHVALATGIPNAQKWEHMKRVLVERTGLLQHEEHRTCLVDALYLVEQQDSGYFQVLEQFPLLGT